MKIKIFNLIFLTIFIILKPMDQCSTTEEKIKKESTFKAIQIIESIALGGVTGTLSYFALKDNNYENNAEKLISLLVGLTSSSVYLISILIKKLNKKLKNEIEEAKTSLEKKCNKLQEDLNKIDIKFEPQKEN
jgi:hypothetical protein